MKNEREVSSAEPHTLRRQIIVHWYSTTPHNYRVCLFALRVLIAISHLLVLCLLACLLSVYVRERSRVHRVVSEIGVDKCFEPTTNAHAWLMQRMFSVIVGGGE